MKKTVISTFAQFSLPDTWAPPDRRRDNPVACMRLLCGGPSQILTE
jgi:hypothetical protein